RCTWRSRSPRRPTRRRTSSRSWVRGASRSVYFHRCSTSRARPGLSSAQRRQVPGRQARARGGGFPGGRVRHLLLGGLLLPAWTPFSPLPLAGRLALESALDGGDVAGGDVDALL